VHVSLTVPGAIDLAGTIRSAELGEARFAQSISLRKPRALFVTQDPVGSEKHLAGVLNAGQFEIQLAEELDASKLDEFQLLIINNIDIEQISLEDKDRTETWIKQGGGLLLIAGERMTYLESKKTEDALDRALPAKLAPPRSPEGTCVVLIVDKSSSMEGRKMELARVASIGVIENLRAVDLVGVDHRDGPRHGRPADLVEQRLAVAGRHEFRIRDAGDPDRLRQHDGTGDNGTG